MLVGTVLLIAALSLVLWNWHESNQGGESAKKIRDTLHSALEEEEQTGNGFPIATTIVSVPERQTTTQVVGGIGSGQDSETGMISGVETSRRRLRMHGMPIRRQPEQILPKNKKYGRKLIAIGILAF